MSVQVRPHLRVRALVVAALAVAVGLPSLAFPYGRDQGLYSYIGREWADGRLPYRDTFDIKTPGIYAVHALAHTVARDSLRAIRVLDLVATLAVGVLAAVAARGATDARHRGAFAPLAAVGALAASVAYYGHFDFWSTGQCEIWCGLAAAAALALARTSAQDAGPGAALGRVGVVGALVGAALLFKPPGLLLATPAAVIAVARAAATDGPLRRLGPAPRWLLGTVAVGAGVALPFVVLLVYYANHGALGDLYGILVEQNRYYVKAGKTYTETSEVLYALGRGVFALAPLLPVVALVAAAKLLGARRAPSGAPHALALTLLAAALLGVIGQMKFFWYHFGLFVLPIAFATTAAVRGDVERAGRGTLRTAALLVAALTLAGRAGAYRDEAWAAACRARETCTPTEAARVYDASTGERFSSHLAEEAAAWLEAHTRPEDELAVRGFEPQIYLAAHRRFPGRFFWTTFLHHREYALHLDAWVAEDARVFVTNPPRFVLAFDWVSSGVDAAEEFVALGYRRVGTIGTYVALERDDGPDAVKLRAERAGRTP